MTLDAARLFAREVPAIRDGVVQIVAIARRAGKRTKIAVRSFDEQIDPIAEVCGSDGKNITRIVGLLGDAEVDVVPWDDNPAMFVCNALAPLEIARVIIDYEGHRMELFVPDEMIHMTPGDDGLRLVLAAELTGWRIDVHRLSRYVPSAT